MESISKKKPASVQAEAGYLFEIDEPAIRRQGERFRLIFPLHPEGVDKAPS